MSGNDQSHIDAQVDAMVQDMFIFPPRVMSMSGIREEVPVYVIVWDEAYSSDDDDLPMQFMAGVSLLSSFGEEDEKELIELIDGWAANPSNMLLKEDVEYNLLGLVISRDANGKCFDFSGITCFENDAVAVRTLHRCLEQARILGKQKLLEAVARAKDSAKASAN